MGILLRGRRSRLSMMTLLGWPPWLVAVRVAPAQAPTPTARHLRYTFQPDCLPCRRQRDLRSDAASTSICSRRSPSGWRAPTDPQFIDTLMVTNLVAARGIGNRPGMLELPVGSQVSLRQAADGAADLGARARQALRRRRHAGGRPRGLAGLARAALDGGPLLLPPAAGAQIAPSSHREVDGRRHHLPDQVQQRQGEARRRQPKVVLPAAQRPDACSAARTATSSAA